MKTVYVYDSHCGWDDLIYLKDKEISDIDRFCPVCEEWDQLIGIANNKAELIEILNMHNIGTKKIFEELLEKFDEIQSIDYGSEIVKKEELKVGLFFFVKGNFSFSGCPLSKAESYGDFLVYPESHYDVWDKYHYLHESHSIPYDYNPRGRIVYRKSDDTFIIYYDKCVESELNRISREYEQFNVRFELDEHYVCHKCNKDYLF